MSQPVRRASRSRRSPSELPKPPRRHGYSRWVYVALVIVAISAIALAIVALSAGDADSVVGARSMR